MHVKKGYLRIHLKNKLLEMKLCVYNKVTEIIFIKEVLQKIKAILQDAMLRLHSNCSLLSSH